MLSSFHVTAPRNDCSTAAAMPGRSWQPGCSHTGTSASHLHFFLVLVFSCKMLFSQVAALCKFSPVLTVQISVSPCLAGERLATAWGTGHGSRAVFRALWVVSGNIS